MGLFRTIRTVALTGHVTTIIPSETPCFNCIFPVAPPPETFPILGSTAEVVGTIQATEVIKYPVIALGLSQLGGVKP